MIVTLEVRVRIPASIFLHVEHMGMPYQRVRWYHSLSAARRRKAMNGGRLFELSTASKQEIE